MTKSGQKGIRRQRAEKAQLKTMNEGGQIGGGKPNTTSKWQNFRSGKWFRLANIVPIRPTHFFPFPFAAFDIVPEISELKRHCFLGALWLCDGQSVRFFDYLNTEIGCSSLDGPHINYICHIAIAAKEVTGGSEF